MGLGLRRVVLQYPWRGGRFRPESVAAFNRNPWQPSPGIGGRFRPESVATFDRNTQAFSAFRKSHGLGARVVRCLGAVNSCQTPLVVCAAAGLRSMMRHDAFTRILPPGQAGKGGAYAI